MKTMSAAAFVLLLVSFAQAQQRWTETYGGPGSDYGSSVQQTTDGGYIIAGLTTSFGAGSFDVYLIKTNASGDTLWTKTCGGNVDDDGLAVRQTSDGGYIIAGFTHSFGAGNEDVYLIKTNALGDSLWTRTYGGTDNDAGHSVQQTSDGGYIIAGGTASFGAGAYDVCLIKTNAFGDTVWTRAYGGTGDDFGHSVQQTSDGGYIVAGYTKSFGAGGCDFYLIKTNTFGDTLWTRTYGGTGFDEGFSVQQTLDGGYILAGWTNSFGAGSYDSYVVKTNASGDTLWTRTYGGTSQDAVRAVQQTSDGGYTLAGWTNSFGAGVQDVYLIKTNASGDTSWTWTYGGTGDDEGYSVQQASDGGYVITGYTTSFGAGGSDVYLIKTDANGSPGVEEPRSRRQVAMGCIRATPNPFTSYARIPGHEAERFDVYDISGKMVGAYRGSRVGEGLSPAVYFIKPGDEPGVSLRIVKVR